MARKKYGLLEDKIISLFSPKTTFSFKGINYEVITSGKPRPSSGECKTDVYISARPIGKSTQSVTEIKISVKTKSSNEFQGNKLTASNAESYFGLGWENIIYQAAKSLSNSFETAKVIYVSGSHPTKPNSITLGWKLEIASKPRALSVPIPLNEQEIRNYIYKGTNQSSSKKDAYVNGIVIKDSGIADYLIKTELNEINSPNDVINQLESIDTLPVSKTYLIFTANNYRTKEDKCDGPRSLAVYIKWSCVNNQLVPTYVYDKPLMFTGQNDIKPILLEALKKLGKNHPSEFIVSEDICSTYLVKP